jgi:sulfur dioxygenase
MEIVIMDNDSTRMIGGAILRHGTAIGFQQLFDPESSTYTYLLWDTATKDALLVDPVDTQVERDLQVATDLGLNLVYAVNTHAHADHITGTHRLKQRIPGGQFRSVIAADSGAAADVHLAAGDRIVFGRRFLEARATPGHTDGCLSYVADDSSFVLTGDALLIQGCGRTDFQGGSAATLYDSVHSQLFTLPPDTVVYPAHDYMGRRSSTIGIEKETNPRLGKGKTKEEFIEIMAHLNLAYPKKMDVAVPTNMRCGIPDV